MLLYYIEGAKYLPEVRILCQSCRDDVQSLGYLDGATISDAGQWGDECDLCGGE